MIEEGELPHQLLHEDIGVLSYSSLPDQPLRGCPIREGNLWFLSGEDSIDPVSFALYVNGFSCVDPKGNQEVTVSLSPFVLVRTCKFQSAYTNTLNLSDFKLFKVSHFTQGKCYYFGVRGEDGHQAEEERSRWVLDFSRAVRLVTQSLFPPFCLSCDPIVSIASTQRRLMAGYLAHHEDTYLVSVLYCELHPHCDGSAKLSLYENELCRTKVMDIFISQRSVCCEKIGMNCSCFCVEDHQFAARTLSERKLWLRAISNVKVKLQNSAPNPTLEEIDHYRLAIKEHIESIKSTLVSKAPTDALLQCYQQLAQVAAEPVLAVGISSPTPSKGTVAQSGNENGDIAELDPKPAAELPIRVQT